MWRANMKCFNCNYDGIMTDNKCPKCGFNFNDRSLFENEMKQCVEEAEVLLREKKKQTEEALENLKIKGMEEETAKSEKSKKVKQITYTAKSYSTAVLLWLFLGGFGAHKFYLEKLPLGFGYIVLLAFSIAFPPFFILLIIFWIIDICTLRDQVNAFNKELESKL